jgi:hypothetical protein
VACPLAAAYSRERSVGSGPVQNGVVAVIIKRKTGDTCWLKRYRSVR